MIDLNRTSSIGVAGLKRFLEYAEKVQGTHPAAPFPLYRKKRYLSKIS